MFRTNKESKRTAKFTKGDKVKLKINLDGIPESRFKEIEELFGEIYEVMYWSFTHQNWICQDESGNQVMFADDKIELANESKKIE